ncbi:MAG TPA: VWA domain-containing protein, partial [Candidatus Limnocylindrales bacterium]|nr:VWA domain-containing protein [Candidatus Limnocylindrales bacterium]
MFTPGVRRLTVSFILALASFCLPLPAHSQTSHPESSQASKNNSSKPAAPVHASTRMVSLEVVAKNHQGRHATGLTAADFQVFEQAPSRGKARHEQKIAVFREVRIADLATQAGSGLQVPAGVHTNLVSLQKEPIPPTILLVDGLNTDVRFQSQVHVQMLRMLRSLPSNVPVAVFLLGHRLRLLQNFTTDPALLQAALDNAITPAGQGLAQVHPRDDPNSLAAQLETMGQFVPPEAIAAAWEFEQQTYGSTMDTRVYETIEALISLARHLSGFPGRKNLLWISTTFPISLAAGAELHNYAPL